MFRNHKGPTQSWAGHHTKGGLVRFFAGTILLQRGGTKTSSTGGGPEDFCQGAGHSGHSLQGRRGDRCHPSIRLVLLDRFKPRGGGPHGNHTGVHSLSPSRMFQSQRIGGGQARFKAAALAGPPQPRIG